MGFHSPLIRPAISLGGNLALGTLGTLRFPWNPIHLSQVKIHFITIKVCIVWRGHRLSTHEKRWTTAVKSWQHVDSGDISLRIQNLPDRIGFLGLQSHPKRIGMDRGNPFLRTYKRILRVFWITLRGTSFCWMVAGCLSHRIHGISIISDINIMMCLKLSSSNSCKWFTSAYESVDLWNSIYPIQQGVHCLKTQKTNKKKPWKK